MIQSFLFLTFILLVRAKRNKLARISPISRNDSGNNNDRISGRGKLKQPKGTLDVEELQVVGLSQVLTINVSFFEHETSNMLFTWMKSSLSDQTDGDNTTWYGEALNGVGSMTIIQPHPAHIAGSVTFNDTLYMITALPNGTVQVDAINVNDLPQETLSMDDVTVLPKSNITSRRNLEESSTVRNLANMDDGSIIDIMCIYTRQALCWEAVGADYCNITLYRRVMDDKCALAVAETNVAFNLSGVQTSLRLVHSDFMDPSYTESVTFQQNIKDLLYNSSSVFQRVRDLRDQYQADLVGLILNNPQSCGASPMYYNDEYYGYFSVSRTCMTGYYSFGHEIGHNLGCYHEMNQYSSPYPSSSSFGYADPSGALRTIMTYTCTNNANCPRVQRFSNPTRTYTANKKNITIGSSLSNNVAQINSVVYNVANYRQSAISFTNAPTIKPKSMTLKPTKYPNKVTATSPTKIPSKKPSFNSSNSCSQSQVVANLSLDRPNVIKWTFSDVSSGKTISSGGPYSSTSYQTKMVCLPSGKVMSLTLQDIGNVGFIKSSSTYNVTIGKSQSSASNSYFFTKNNGQSSTSTRSHKISLNVVPGFKYQGTWTSCSMIGVKFGIDCSVTAIQQKCPWSCGSR